MDFFFLNEQSQNNCVWLLLILYILDFKVNKPEHRLWPPEDLPGTFEAPQNGHISRAAFRSSLLEKHLDELALARGFICQ